MAQWKIKIKLKDLLGLYNKNVDELKETRRIKPFWIKRIGSIPILKSFLVSLKKVNTLNSFNNWLDSIYDFCDEYKIWIE
jgi:hypothetical protein